ncbi:iron chelate uptake ABC transporter family permease subunit [Mycoplasmoides pirum]|uniref:iron chelate uptake ABC transporter family permease subunit n=1 Tax=Mycoplasmoides pirum TaxID=2122 RepID=UPI0004806C1D|nr:iron chelate uptake ABC transporter family permease subunit [Mycoplasmoides pirum]
METFKKSKLKYFLICLLFCLIAISLILIGFSITTNGSLIFLNSINSENRIDYLSIGLGIIGCIIVAISLNFAGEASQSLTRNILASPFTLGLTPIMTLSYLISSLTNNFPIWAIGLLSLCIMFIFNILPTFYISISKFKHNQNIVILYGLSLSILISSLITLLSFFSKDQSFNVLGWMIIEVITFSESKFIYGSLFFVIGAIIFLLNIKKIHIIEHAYFKASTLNINFALLNMISLLAISLMCIGGFIAYAPFTLLGFAIPYITKKHIINNYDVRWSLLPSTLLSLIVTLLAFIVNCYLQTYIDVVTIIIMLPFVICMFISKRNYYE